MRAGQSGAVRFNYHSPPSKNTSDYMMHLIPQPIVHPNRPPVFSPPSHHHPISPSPVQKIVSPNRKKLHEIRQQQYGHLAHPSALQRTEPITRISQQRSTLSQASDHRSVRSISQKDGCIEIEMQEDSPPPKIVVTQRSKGSVLLPQVQTGGHSSQISLQGRPRGSSSLSNYSSNTVRVQQPMSHISAHVPNKQTEQVALVKQEQYKQISHCVETIEQQARPLSVQFTANHMQTFQPHITNTSGETHVVATDSPEQVNKVEHSFNTPADLLKDQPAPQPSPTAHRTSPTPEQSQAYPNIAQYNSRQVYQDGYPQSQHYYSHSQPFFQSQEGRFEQRQRQNYHQRMDPQYQYYQSERSDYDWHGSRRFGIQCYVNQDMIANQRRLVDQIFQSETQRALFRMGSIQKQSGQRQSSRHRHRI